LLTGLIIRVGGKLLCQVFFFGKWLIWYWLWSFLGVEGLDKGNYWAFCGSWSGKSPGLKPPDSARLIQGAEAPCSLRKDKGKSGFLRCAAE